MTSTAATDGRPGEPRQPRTERGRRTLRRLLDAAAQEFAEHGFHAASISGITRRAGIALGSFYTYFESKDALFRALVQDLSGRVAQEVRKVRRDDADALAGEQAALTAFLHFAREHKEIYRIIDESEFVDPDTYRLHYASTAARMLGRLQDGMAAGELRDDLEEAHAWAIMGMNVFLGLRYAIWSEDRTPEDVAAAANRLLRDGIRKAPPE